jgi:glyceraldehyde-3-phosphate dehydrogenase (NAD(P))
MEQLARGATRHKEEQMSAVKTTRVAVNGYGVIGKRVADAVAQQDDMELAGVAISA